MAKDLHGPDGLALDLKNGDLYVSEESAAGIVRIRANGERDVVIDGATPVYEEHGDPGRKRPACVRRKALPSTASGLCTWPRTCPAAV